MNRRHSVPFLVLVALAGLGILFALLRPWGPGRTSDEERRSPGTSRASGEPSGPAALSASLDNRAVSVSEVLALPELRAAVGSFRLVDTLMNTFPAESNGRRRLAALQQRLFRDDVAFASGLDPRIACDRVPEMLEQLKAGSAEGDSPRQASSARSIPWPERLVKARSASLAERHKVLIADTHQGGIAVIVKLLASHLDQPVPGSGAFQDAGLYAALRTYLLEAQAENSRESAAVIRKLKKESSDSNPAIAANQANAVDAESAEYRQVLEAYQSIFAYRLGNWLGIEGDELIERLAKATVSGVGSEWNVPCAWRY